MFWKKFKKNNINTETQDTTEYRVIYKSLDNKYRREYTTNSLEYAFTSFLREEEEGVWVMYMLTNIIKLNEEGNDT